MRYMVMETSVAYAVVLDENGKFLKVPNLGYAVGDTLENVVIFEDNLNNTIVFPKRMQKVVRAACVCLLMGGCMWQIPVGTVKITINPQVQLSVNRFERVVGAKALNADGENLLQQFKFYGKNLNEVADSIADKAITDGYLKTGGKITVDVNANNKQWQSEKETTLYNELNSHFNQTINIVIDDDDLDDLDDIDEDDIDDIDEIYEKYSDDIDDIDDIDNDDDDNDNSRSVIQNDDDDDDQVYINSNQNIVSDGDDDSASIIQNDDDDVQIENQNDDDDDSQAIEINDDTQTDNQNDDDIQSDIQNDDSPQIETPTVTQPQATQSTDDTNDTDDDTDN